MYTNIIANSKSMILVVLFISIFFGVAFFAPLQKAHAQTPANSTIAELQALVASLLQQVAQLQLELKKVTGNSSSFGDTVSQCEYDFNRTLYFGVAGNDVSNLQSSLLAAGHYDEEVTGFYGPVTEAAVKSFQAANGIVSSGNPVSTGFGVVGPKTRSVLTTNATCARSGDVAIVEEYSAAVRKNTVAAFELFISRNPDHKLVRDAEARIDLLKGINQSEAEVSIDISAQGMTATLSATFTITKDQRLNAVTGPVVLGTASWGDGSTAKLSGLANADKVTATANHTYTLPGTYTVVVADKNSNSDKESVRIASDSVSSYGISDVRSVNSRYVDPIPNAVDDEYTEYTITLKKGTVHKVNAAHFAPQSAFERLLRDTGYTGNVDKLIAMASSGTSLSITQPVKGTYLFGDNLTIRWSANVSSDAGMYLVLEDNKGNAIKSMKVKPGSGQATMDTTSNCNNFFSDAIDGACSTLKTNITTKGQTQYRIRALVYSPSNACFGFCAPKNITNIKTIATDIGGTFTIEVEDYGKYGLSQVKSVTVQSVDPIATAVDDEYSLYTITLVSGQVHTVKTFGNATESMNDQAFYATGYDGDVDKLIALAKVIPPKPTGKTLHVISVYQGADGKASFCTSAWGKVDVNLSATLGQSPVTLSLNAYEPVIWNIKNPSGVQISKIILSGYNSQTVTGIASGVSVEHRTFYQKDSYIKGGNDGQGAFYNGAATWPGVIYNWASQCPESKAIATTNRHYLKGNASYNYDNKATLLNKLRTWTGLEATSYQSTSNGSSFTVGISPSVQGVATTGIIEKLKNIAFELQKLVVIHRSN